MSTIEIWRPVVGFEGAYEVSDQGRVRSVQRTDGIGRRVNARVLRPGVATNGYPLVSLWREGRGSSQFVHHLVAAAFIGPRPPGMDICHEDGNRLNHVASNLRYDTRAANLADARRHGTLPGLRKTHCPRGHRLAEPNLVPSVLPMRNCLSCARERSLARTQKRPFDPARADTRYADLGFTKENLSA